MWFRRRLSALKFGNFFWSSSWWRVSISFGVFRWPVGVYRHRTFTRGKSPVPLAEKTQHTNRLAQITFRNYRNAFSKSTINTPTRRRYRIPGISGLGAAAPQKKKKKVPKSGVTRILAENDRYGWIGRLFQRTESRFRTDSALSFPNLGRLRSLVPSSLIRG